jgi:hypothetical protein
MSAIELADAQLARVMIEADRVTLRLASAPAWRAGEGADTRPVPGHLSGVALVFEGASVQWDAGCAPGDCIGAVREARLQRDGHVMRELSVSADWMGGLILQLVLRNGAGLQVKAQRLRLTLADDSRFTESLAC